MNTPVTALTDEQKRDEERFRWAFMEMLIQDLVVHRVENGVDVTPGSIRRLAFMFKAGQAYGAEKT